MLYIYIFAIFYMILVENMVKVTLDGQYTFDLVSGVSTLGSVCLQRRSRTHKGIDTLGRCLIVQTPGIANSNLRLRLDEGNAYRYI